jgi:hypothetical protein
MVKPIIWNGLLTYYGWNRPWEIEDDSKRTHDLREAFWDFAEQLNDQIAHHVAARDLYELAAGNHPDPDMVQPKSGYALRFETRGEGIILSAREPWGFSNVAAYLGTALASLNARHIMVRSSGGRFQIRADPDRLKLSPEVRYAAETNMGAIMPGDEKTICRAGEGRECCVFLTAGAGGFECAKFAGSLADHLIARKVEGTIHAARIGNCRNVGRLPTPDQEESA